MKKTLILLGLLVSSMGIAMADEVVSPEVNAAQQVEIQSQLDRQTFQNDNYNRRFNNPQQYNFDKKNENQRIKYDKSVKNQKFNQSKYGKQPKFDDKTGKRIQRNDIRNDRFNPGLNARYPDFRNGRPNQYMGHHRRPHHGYRAHRHHPSHMRNYNARNKFDSRRAYNKSLKRK